MAFGGLVVGTGFSATLGPFTLTGVSAGATILVFTVNSGGGPTSISDAQGSYTAVANNATLSVFKLLNANVGSHAISGNWGANNGISMVCAWYTNGDVTGTPFVGDDSFIGSGANVITENTTPAADNALLIGYVHNTSGSGTYSAGTSPNAFVSRNITSGIATTSGLLEDFGLGAGTGGSAQTITMGTTANTGQFIAFFALAAPASGALPGPLPQLMYVMP